MGSELTLNQALYSPQSNWQSTDTVIVAGEYQAIGISGAGIAAAQLEKLKTDSEAVQALLEDCRDNNNCEPVQNLNKHQITGAILQAGVLGWFAMSESQDQLSREARTSLAIQCRHMENSEYRSKVQYSWGIARDVSFPGVLMDIDFKKVLVESKQNDKTQKLNYIRMSGSQASANEHVVPEQLFSTSENPVQGISAVKAFSIAAAEGQRIFTLTQSNIGQLANIYAGCQYSK